MDLKMFKNLVNKTKKDPKVRKEKDLFEKEVSILSDEEKELILQKKEEEKIELVKWIDTFGNPSDFVKTESLGILYNPNTGKKIDLFKGLKIPKECFNVLSSAYHSLNGPNPHKRGNKIKHIGVPGFGSEFKPGIVLWKKENGQKVIITDPMKLGRKSMKEILGKSDLKARNARAIKTLKEIEEKKVEVLANGKEAVCKAKDYDYERLAGQVLSISKLKEYCDKLPSMVRLSNKEQLEDCLAVIEQIIEEGSENQARFVLRYPLMHRVMKECFEEVYNLLTKG